MGKITLEFSENVAEEFGVIHAVVLGYLERLAAESEDGWVYLPIRKSFGQMRGLSKTSVSKVLRELCDHGILQFRDRGKNREYRVQYGWNEGVRITDSCPHYGQLSALRTVVRITDSETTQKEPGEEVGLDDGVNGVESQCVTPSGMKFGKIQYTGNKNTDTSVEIEVNSEPLKATNTRIPSSDISSLRSDISSELRSENFSESNPQTSAEPQPDGEPVQKGESKSTSKKVQSKKTQDADGWRAGLEELYEIFKEHYQRMRRPFETAQFARAIRPWRALTTKDQRRAIDYAPVYLQSLQPSERGLYFPVHLNTYLHDTMWVAAEVEARELVSEDDPRLIRLKELYARIPVAYDQKRWDVPERTEYENYRKEINADSLGAKYKPNDTWI